MHDALDNHARILAWVHFSSPPLYNPAITTAECTIIKHLKSSNKDSGRPFVGLDFCFLLTLVAVKLHKCSYCTLLCILR